MSVGRKVVTFLVPHVSLLLIASRGRGEGITGDFIPKSDNLALLGTAIDCQLHAFFLFVTRGRITSRPQKNRKNGEKYSMPRLPRIAEVNPQVIGKRSEQEKSVIRKRKSKKEMKMGLDKGRRHGKEKKRDDQMDIQVLLSSHRGYIQATKISVSTQLDFKFPFCILHLWLEVGAACDQFELWMSLGMLQEQALVGALRL